MVQVLPLLINKGKEHFGFTGEQISIMCGSHGAENEHLVKVNEILARIESDENYLNCGPHEPSNDASFRNLIRLNQKPRQIHNNCSGKHAGFLAHAKLLNSPLDGYLDLDHPVQLAVREMVGKMAGVDPSNLEVGIDGCSAPNFALSVRQLAQVYASLIAPPQDDEHLVEACKTVIESVSQHPFYVAGTDRYCTWMMHITKGRVFGKLGAAGVYAFGIPELGLAGAVKMEDGVHGPQYHVVNAILLETGLLSADDLNDAKTWHHEELRNCNQRVVGKVYADENFVSELSKALKS